MRNPDTWKITVEVDLADAETAEFVLGELGSLGSIEEDAKREGYVAISAFFEREAHDRARLRDAVSEAFAAFPGLSDAWIEVDLEPARDWNERWREHFRPFEIAQGFVVVPSWERYDMKPGERIIHLDPGMAFGTGLHETTRLCAEALLAHVGRGIEGPAVLDVGTGSGILAIMAHMMGARAVAAVDNDPDALAVARENFEKNGCARIATAYDIAQVPGRFDVVIANILLPTLLALVRTIADHTADGGIIILSGVTLDQEEPILEAYTPFFSPADMSRRGEWSALVLRKKGAVSA